MRGPLSWRRVPWAWPPDPPEDQVLLAGAAISAGRAGVGVGGGGRPALQVLRSCKQPPGAAVRLSAGRGFLESHRPTPAGALARPLPACRCPLPPLLATQRPPRRRATEPPKLSLVGRARSPETVTSTLAHPAAFPRLISLPSTYLPLI